MNENECVSKISLMIQQNIQKGENKFKKCQEINFSLMKFINDRGCEPWQFAHLYQHES